MSSSPRLRIAKSLLAVSLVYGAVGCGLIPDSLLNWTERIIRMRKELPEIGWGNFKVIAARDPAVLIIRYDRLNNSLLSVHNLDEKPREISFASGVSGDAGKLLVNLLSEDHSRAGGSGRHKLVLDEYGYRWYRVGGLDYLLKRSDIDSFATDARDIRAER